MRSTYAADTAKRRKGARTSMAVLWLVCYWTLAQFWHGFFAGVSAPQATYDRGSHTRPLLLAPPSPRSNLSRARAPGKKRSLLETKASAKTCPTSTPAASTTSPPRRRKKRFQEDAPRPRASLEEATSRGGRPVPGTISSNGAPASPPHPNSRSGRRPGSPMPLLINVPPADRGSRPLPEGTTVDIVEASSATTARSARC